MAKERPGLMAGLVNKRIAASKPKRGRKKRATPTRNTNPLGGDQTSRAKFEKGRKANAEFFGSRRGGTSRDPGQLASARNYKIKSGDTLSQIARNYGVSLKALKDNNKIADANKIRAGQTIKVPAKLSAKATDVYRDTDISKITKGQTPAQVAAQKKRNVKTDAAEKAKNLASRKDTPAQQRKRTPAASRRRGPAAKRMSGGGVARGMGAATKGGKFTRNG